MSGRCSIRRECGRSLLVAFQTFSWRRFSVRSGRCKIHGLILRIVVLEIFSVGCIRMIYTFIYGSNHDLSYLTIPLSLPPSKMLKRLLPTVITDGYSVKEFERGPVSRLVFRKSLRTLYLLKRQSLDSSSVSKFKTKPQPCYLNSGSSIYMKNKTKNQKKQGHSKNPRFF